MTRFALWVVIAFPLMITVAVLTTGHRVEWERATYIPNRAVSPPVYRDVIFRDMPEFRFFHQGAFRGTLRLQDVQTVLGDRMILMLDKGWHALGIFHSVWFDEIAIEVPMPESLPARIPISPDSTVFWSSQHGQAAFRATRVTGEVTLERWYDTELLAAIDLAVTGYLGPHSWDGDLSPFEGLSHEDVLGETMHFRWTTLFERGEADQLVHGSEHWLPRFARREVELTRSLSIGLLTAVLCFFWGRSTAD